jgi:hypothetical protein
MGRISKASLSDFKTIVAPLIDKTGKLYLMPISPDMYKQLLLYGAAFNQERLSMKTINIVL